MMGLFYFPSEALVEFCMLVVLLLAIAQAFHVALIWKHSVRLRRYARLSYETSLIYHLTVMAMLFYSISQHWVPNYLQVGVLAIPLEVLIWGNIVVVGLGIWLSAKTLRLQTVIELMGVIYVLFVTTFNFGDSTMSYLIVDVAIFTYAVTRHLVKDLAYSQGITAPPVGNAEE